MWRLFSSRYMQQCHRRHISLSLFRFQSSSSGQAMSDVRALRLEKINTMKSKGINPFAYNFTPTITAADLKQLHKDLPNGMEDTAAVACIAGRIMIRRFFGKLAFFELRDHSDSIQLYIDKKRLGDEFNNLQNWTDSGDIIGVSGSVKRTEKGELSVYVSKWQMLTKSLIPLPDKYHGLTDTNTRYRNRHLDMIANPKVVTTIKNRALVISRLRRYLEEAHFTEVETPVLTAQPGGADAKPFLTYHNSLDMPLSLRIATELHLKRLVVGGIHRVFEIGRIFRNEGLSTRHNPEFTTLEFYEAYGDFETMMQRTEELIVAATQAITSKELSNQDMRIKYQDHDINLSPPFRRISMHDIVQETTGVTFNDFYLSESVEDAKKAAIAAGVKRSALQDVGTVGEVLNATFEELCEQTLVQPTFITDHPIETSPLAKPHRSKPHVVERFELYIFGREIANAFSELTDPVDQRQRFEKQARERSLQVADTNVQSDNISIDEEFVEALEVGMPPTGGCGIGIDRLVMLLTDSQSIKDVIAFPLLRKERLE